MKNEIMKRRGCMFYEVMGWLTATVLAVPLAFMIGRAFGWWAR